jgi:hypothetical protein
MSNANQNKKPKKSIDKWTRTTVLIRNDHLEKFKILAWWERTTVKDLFNDMIEKYLSSKDHIDSLIQARKQNSEEKVTFAEENK